MDYEIIKINDNSYRVEDSGVRFFLLIGNDKALLIDSGMRVASAKEIVMKLTDKPIELFNTHADPDHIGSNKDFNEFYMHKNELDFYRSRGGKGNPIFVKEGDIIDLGGRKLKVIELFGHTKGSIALLDMDNRVLISGDSIQDGTIYMTGAHRDFNNYIKSLEALNKYRNEFDEIWPSHSSFTVSPDMIDVVHDYALKIINKEVKGDKIPFRDGEVIKYDFPKASFLADE